MKRIVSGIMLTLLLTSILMLTFSSQPVKASGTIYIRADGSIEPVTAPISSFDSIFYTFTDNINDSIVIERDNVIVDGAGYILQGAGSGTGIDLSRRSNVTIKNMEIKTFFDGIYLQKSSNNSIHGNNITASREYGIFLLFDSSNNTIYGNNITNNEDAYGIRLWQSSNYNSVYGNNITNNKAGVVLHLSSNNNTISRNNITNNEEEGIWFAGCSGNTISANSITASGKYGVWLWDSSKYNSINGNDIAYNEAGVVLGDPRGGWVDVGNNSDNNIHRNNITDNKLGIRLSVSSDNSVFHNNFVHNTIQVQSLDSANAWDDGYPSGGNYWSDYTGVDLYSGPYQNETGSDGIGDIPCIVHLNIVDRYPLMHHWSSLPVHNINIGLGYDAIQQAIDSNETLDGHAIFVDAGKYYENVVVNKTVSLIGEDRDTTIIVGSGTGSVVTITANNTMVGNFTIRESGKPTVEYTPYTDTGILVFAGYGQVVENTAIFNNDIRDNYVGLFIWYSLGNIVVDNNIANNYFGIGIDEAIYNNICRNMVSNNAGGIWLGSGGNNVGSNIISSNLAFGVQIDGSYLNTVDGNVIEYNGCGIELQGASNNITANTVRNNGYAISMGGSEDNLIYYNNFMNNTEQVERALGYYNIWDNNSPSGGNYWSDHNPPDKDIDKIGDVPYVIDENNTDRYPLIYPYGYVPKPDINNDGIVNIVDIATVAKAFGCKPGDSDWNPIADMDINETINIVDVATVAKEFGKGWNGMGS